MSYSALRLTPLATWFVIVAMGCSDTPNAANPQADNLKAIVSFYNYMTSQTGIPPSNEQQFKQFIATNGTAYMERLNIVDPDELFVSERDGQPLVIVYGPRPEGMSRDVVAYEKTGIGGKRRVGMALGMVQELDEAQFRELVPPSAAPR